MKQIIQSFADNAMLYKDITQWLRNRTFVILFFGLLLIAEVIAIMFITLPIQGEERLGMAMFSFLTAILFLYMLIIGFTGFSLTSKEFNNRTFELYELAGMSLEKMVLGKLFSMISQFLFGFFCIIPFMFFAFILGGLDFYLILTAGLSMGFSMIPLFLFALMIALLAKFKSISTIGKLGMLFLFIFIIPGIVQSFFHVTMRGSPGIFGPTGFNQIFKSILSLDPDALLGVAIFFGFYIQICLLLFYLCCNAISPNVDSREMPIKLFCFTLCGSIMAVFSYLFMRFGLHEAPLYFVGFTVFGITIASQLLFFNNRITVPVMIGVRYGRTKSYSPMRILQYWFEPSAHGAFRTLCLTYLSLIVYALCVYQLYPIFQGRPVSTKEFENIISSISIPMQISFFLFFPGWIYLHFRRFRENHTRMRMGVLMWWVLLGVPIMLLTVTFGQDVKFRDTSYFVIIKLFSLFVSPISSVTTYGYEQIEYPAAWIRMIFGVIGLYGMVSMLRTRKKWNDAKGYANTVETKPLPRENPIPATVPAEESVS